MLSLPSELLAHTGPLLQVDRPVQGGFFSAYILTAERGRFVLKLGARPELIAELQAEHAVLATLHGEAAGFVPQPVAHTVQDDTGYFLFTCVEGDNMLTALATADSTGRRALAAEVGWALRRVHSSQPAFPRPADWLSEALAEASARVTTGAVPNPVEHRGRTGGRDPHEVLVELRTWRPTVANETVFAHLDFCVPNTLALDGQVVGVIDWSRGRYADRRVDLASMAWSIRYNTKDEACVQAFLDAYGYTAPAESLHPFEALWVLLG